MRDRSVCVGNKRPIGVIIEARRRERENWRVFTRDIRIAMGILTAMLIVFTLLTLFQ